MRMNFGVTLLAACILHAVLCVSSARADATAETAAKPNVLFIAIDDLNDWIGCLGGHPQALTPNMDRLAQRGVLFTNAHCAAPACNPSRAAVFSGRMAQTSGVWSNDKGQSLNHNFPDGVLLPESLRKAGYTTLGTGKLLHSKGKDAFEEYFSVGQRWSPFLGKSHEYTAAELPSKGTDNPRHAIKHNGKTYTLPLNRMPSDRAPNEAKGESFDWGPFDVPDEDFGDTQITNWAIEQINESRERPFFLGVGYYRPHIPLFAPKRFFDRFSNEPGKLPYIKENDLDDLGDAAKKWAIEAVTAGSHATVLKHGQWQEAVEAYLACVTYIDHEVGRLLDALDSSSVGKNTIIVLWSDHGWHLGEKQHWGKWTGWERSTKVPLIIAPAKRDAKAFDLGTRCDQPVSLIDMYPTLMELCGATGPTLDGESLVPLLRKPTTQTHRAVVTMFNPGNGSLRTDRWRYIRYADGSHELYDLENDPHEWTNLGDAPQHTKLKEQLHARLQPYVQSSTTP